MPGGRQAGISTADRVVTVCPGYAWEIQTPEDLNMRGGRQTGISNLRTLIALKP